MSESNKPQFLFLIVDKNNEIILDSQRRPTIYRSEKQLETYRYKFKDTDKVIVYSIDDELTIEELEQKIRNIEYEKR